jgi:hypothetical protein
MMDHVELPLLRPSHPPYVLRLAPTSSDGEHLAELTGDGG